ncbi:MAG: DUF3846 domain-containing protein [Clostridia bacterium]|nr:DUF3846 domain-containing protein [Clostridia bacterium]
MRVKLYQIDETKDVDRRRFLSYDDALSFGPPDAKIYEKVFDGELQAGDLEEIYDIFNTDLPPGYAGRSMSVSDVVEISERTGDAPKGSYYCDVFGFRKLEKFGQTPSEDMKTADSEEKGIRMLVLEPGKTPYEKTVSDELKSLQTEVGGLIEITYPFDDNAIVIGNEEAKLIGMEGNRRINGSVYAGPLLIAGDDGRGGMTDLTDEQVKKYSDMFQTPEYIPQSEVEADTGFTFIPW